VGFYTSWNISVFKKTCATTQKNHKSHVFWILKKKTFKNICIVLQATQPLITQLLEVSTGKSRSPTSNILLRSVDTRNYATENCVINAYTVFHKKTVPFVILLYLYFYKAKFHENPPEYTRGIGHYEHKINFRDSLTIVCHCHYNEGTAKCQVNEHKTKFILMQTSVYINSENQHLLPKLFNIGLLWQMFKMSAVCKKNKDGDADATAWQRCRWCACPCARTPQRCAAATHPEYGYSVCRRVPGACPTRDSLLDLDLDC